MVDYKIYVNGVVVEESLGNYWRYSKTDFILGEKEYFVLGDNRADSTDSRWFGPITRSDIVAKAMFNILFWR